MSGYESRWGMYVFFSCPIKMCCKSKVGSVLLSEKWGCNYGHNFHAKFYETRNTGRRLISTPIVRSVARTIGLHQSPGSVARFYSVLFSYGSEKKNGTEENLLPEVHVLGSAERRHEEETIGGSQADARFALNITSPGDVARGWDPQTRT